VVDHIRLFSTSVESLLRVAVGGSERLCMYDIDNDLLTILPISISPNMSAYGRSRGSECELRVQSTVLEYFDGAVGLHGVVDHRGIWSNQSCGIQRVRDIVDAADELT